MHGAGRARCLDAGQRLGSVARGGQRGRCLCAIYRASRDLVPGGVRGVHNSRRVTASDREEAHVARAQRIHRAVLEMMTRERPGKDMYTWRDRYLALFQMLWDRPAVEAAPPPPTPPPPSAG